MSYPISRFILISIKKNPSRLFDIHGESRNSQPSEFRGLRSSITIPPPKEMNSEYHVAYEALGRIRSPSARATEEK